MTNQNNKGRPKTTIKFESDFDFEQANTKFDEMRLSLAKLKVGEEAKPEQVFIILFQLYFFYPNAFELVIGQMITYFSFAFQFNQNKEINIQ